MMNTSTKTDWDRLSRLSDKDIDYTDIPETDKDFWNDADVITIHNKVDFTVKIDEDIAIWLKNMGRNSNEAVNNILRAYYLINM